jgi:hypothetical protein
MEKEIYKKPARKDIFHWIVRAVGTFLFVFFMMGAIFVFTAGINTSRWLLPYFILPAYLVCITFGSDYMMGEDPVRRWSYCISSIITSILLVPETAFSIPSYAAMPLLRMILTVLLSVFLIGYGILKVQRLKRLNQQTDVNEKLVQPQKNQIARRKVVRFVCLVSFCCVLLESSHRVITTLFGFSLVMKDGFYFSTLAQFPLAILSAILLARFMKAEFVQRNPSLDRGAQ